MYAGLASLNIPVFCRPVDLTLREDRECSIGASWMIMSESKNGKALVDENTNADVRKRVMILDTCIFSVQQIFVSANLIFRFENCDFLARICLIYSQEFWFI